MLKRFSFILICVSVLIIQGHDVVVHHHDFLHHENDHNEAGHNSFSYVDIDEDFTLQDKIDISNDLIAILSPTVFKIICQESNLITLFVTKNEYPPPKPDISFQSLRGPPIS